MSGSFDDDAAGARAVYLHERNSARKDIQPQPTASDGTISAKAVLGEVDELTWGAEPNIRAEIKMEIAMTLARMMRVRDLIDWQWRMVDGKLEVTGSIRLSPAQKGEA